MAFDDITTRLNLVAGDTSGIDATARSERALNDLTDAVGKTDAKMVNLGKTQRSSFELSKRLAESALRDSKAQLDSIEKQERAYRELTQSIQLAAGADDKRTQSLTKSLSVVEQYDQAFKQASDRSSAFGDVGSSFSTLSGAASGLGAGGLGQGGLLAADLFDSIEALDRVKVAIRGVAEVAGAGEGILGGLANGLSGVIPSLSGASAGFAAIGIAAAGFLAVGAGLTAIIGGINAALEEQKQRTEDLTNQIIAQGEARSQAEALLAQGDITSLLEQRQAAYDELTALRRREAEARQLLTDAEAAAQGVFDPFGVSREANSVNAARAALEELDAPLRDVNTRFFEINQAIEQADPALRAAAEATFVTAQEAERAAVATRQYGEATAEATKQLELLNQQEADLIAQFEANQRQRQADLDRQAARESAASALRVARAQEDLNRTLQRQAQDHAQKLVDIADAGNAQIADLQASIAQKQLDASQAVLDAQKELAAQSAEAASKFQRDELRRLEAFNLSKAQAERRFQQAEEQFVLNNDITGLIEARRNRNIERKEARENFDAQSKLRSEDFAQEQAQREQVTAQRIAAINAELATFTAATQARILQEAASIQERQRLESEAFQARQTQDAQERALKASRDAEDAAIRRQIQEEDRAIFEARQKEALNRQLAAIDAEQAKLNQVNAQKVTALTLESTLLDAIIQKGALALNTLNSTQPPPQETNPLDALGDALSDLLNLPKREFGGGAKRGQALLVGERQAEVFVPQSDGFIYPSIGAARGALGAGMNVNLSINIPNVNVGELVTPNQARTIASEIAGSLRGQIFDTMERVFDYAKRTG